MIETTWDTDNLVHGLHVGNVYTDLGHDQDNETQRHMMKGSNAS